MHSLVKELSLLLGEKKLMLATAESCTGGMIAASITDRAGSASIFDRGFITYSNESKIDMLGVRAETLADHGAVSEQTAAQMVSGALQRSNATIAVSVTGIAGPTGGSEHKPVGLVYIGTGLKDAPVRITRHMFEGDRTAIRQITLETALEQLIAELQG